LSSFGIAVFIFIGLCIIGCVIREFVDQLRYEAEIRRRDEESARRQREAQAQTRAHLALREKQTREAEIAKRDEQIKKNPHKVFPSEICVICQQNFVESTENPIIIRGCGHELHYKCLKAWCVGKENPHCPICEGAIVFSEV
jgi:rubrerythrin